MTEQQRHLNHLAYQIAYSLSKGFDQQARSYIPAFVAADLAVEKGYHDLLADIRDRNTITQSRQSVK